MLHLGPWRCPHHQCGIPAKQKALFYFHSNLLWPHPHWQVDWHMPINFYSSDRSWVPDLALDSSMSEMALGFCQKMNPIGLHIPSRKYCHHIFCSLQKITRGSCCNDDGSLLSPQACPNPSCSSPTEQPSCFCPKQQMGQVSVFVTCNNRRKPAPAMTVLQYRTMQWPLAMHRVLHKTKCMFVPTNGVILYVCPLRQTLLDPTEMPMTTMTTKTPLMTTKTMLTTRVLATMTVQTTILPGARDSSPPLLLEMTSLMPCTPEALITQAPLP